MKFTTLFLCGALLCPMMRAGAQTAPTSPERWPLLEVPRAKIAPLVSADALDPAWRQSARLDALGLALGEAAPIAGVCTSF